MASSSAQSLTHATQLEFTTFNIRLMVLPANVEEALLGLRDESKKLLLLKSPALGRGFVLLLGLENLNH